MSPPRTSRRSATTSDSADSQANVELIVLRGAKEFSVSVKPVEARSEFDSMSSLADPSKNLVSELAHPRRGNRRTRCCHGHGTQGNPYGIIVVARAAGGASDVPVQPRDVIRSVNNRRIPTLAALRQTMRALMPGTTATMQIQRDAAG